MVTIYDLLYGLMLPSGNDAGMTLAENFGEHILASHPRKNPSMENEMQKSSIKLFVKQMNKMCLKLHLKNTYYTNPHGLADKANHSTAFELACVANYAMKNPIFAQIVSTKSYYSENNYLPLKRLLKLPNRDASNYETVDELPFETIDKQEYVHFPQTWCNSNKLLGLPGFGGVKTGITTTAGSCLCVYFTNTKLNKNIITVVLGSKNI